MPKRWLVSEPISEALRAQFPEPSPVLLQLLFNRDISTQEEIDIFLGPDWTRDTIDPWQFAQMRKAVDRVFLALQEGEVITVHGDYDADGVCGSVVLASTLRDICRALSFDEKKITFYIPHREKEGYGFTGATADYLHAHEKTTLVITVDCGISNAPAIARAKELGIDTIVCDHHTIPEVLPKAILLHPLVPGETYPNKFLCGTGVAFKLASALIHEAKARGAAFPDGYEKWLLDLVAIATVTDVMPIKGENRVLEKYGLLVLQKTRRMGLRKLFEVAGIEPAKIDTGTIGFQIGPRVNAAGRMNHASVAVHLLMSEQEDEAARLAHELHAANIARQKASEEMYRAAKEQIGDPGDRMLLVAAEEGWPAGLVGLVAGKLANDFGRPVIVAGGNGDKWVGSGRSIAAFDIMKALHAASSVLEKFGGHPQACGFSVITRERFDAAAELMIACATRELAGAELAPTISIDARVLLSDLDWPLLELVNALQPFGEGNREPTFLVERVVIVRADTMGKDGKHARLLVRDEHGKATKKMVAFGFGGMVQTLRPGAMIDAVVQIGVNEWQGNRELQVKVVDVCERA